MGSDKVKVNIDIEYPYIPCDILSLDVEDSLGQHISDYYGEMHKNRLSQDGSILSTESWKEKKSHGKDLHDRVTKELKEHQGCRMTGHIELQRVPGNFHIGFHAYGDVVARFE